MDSIKNEKGYALVMVLVIITVFMIVSLSFMGQAFSSVKQNKIVEKTSQSVAVAEMGISYYQVAIQNIFELKRQEVNDKVNIILTGNPSKDFKKEAVNAMATTIQQELMKEQTTVPVEGNPNASFTIDKNSITSVEVPNSNKIKISFKVIGTEDEKNTSLKTDMLIDLNSIFKDGESINYVLPAFNEIPKPQGNCTSFSNGCNEILLDSTKPFPDNNNGLTDKTIYSTGNLTVPGNANNSYHVKLHADGVMFFDKNLNKATKLTLETKESATFDGQLKVDSSRILIGKNLTTDKHLDLDTKSFVFVGGNANISQLGISSDSTMCIQGDYTGPSSLPTNNLIVLGKINGNLSGVTPKDFENKCGTLASINLTINWGKTIEAKVNNVDYKQ